MRFVARWSVVVAFCSAVVFAAARPALETIGARQTDFLAATAAPSSGLKAQPPPENRWFVAPAPTIAGPTILKAFVSALSAVASFIPRPAAQPSSQPSRTYRQPQHLRSIPLLI
jgi:hypothetical protein